MKESYFVVMTFVKTHEALEYLAQIIKESVEQITEVDGNSVTVRAKTSCAHRTDEGISDDNIFQKVLGEVDKAQ